ncbi:MAG: hypothetical protein K8R58_10900, partial [Bacteroidales bacterium]|nr:hypothetical protein [Bacteroidales bacterium]
FNFPLIDENSRLKVMYSYDLILIEPQGTGGSHEISLILGFDTIKLIKSGAINNDFPVIRKPIIF